MPLTDTVCGYVQNTWGSLSEVDEGLQVQQEEQQNNIIYGKTPLPGSFYSMAKWLIIKK